MLANRDVTLAPGAILAIIPARGGSKALPRKNIAPFCGKPLIAWTIRAAQQSSGVSRVVVTTDDREIAEVAARHGADVPFMRPAELASDTAPGNAAVFHALQWLDEHEHYRAGIVVLLQPTSPLRTGVDIDAALHLLEERAADSVVSVTPVDHHPQWMKTIDASGWLRNFLDQPPSAVVRQQLPPVYRLNGAIYAARVDALRRAGDWYTPRTAAYVMPAERSVDIDSPWDFKLAELIRGAQG